MTGAPRHLVHVFPTFCAAGAQVRTTTLMRAFGAQFRHTVVSCDGRVEAADLAEGVELRLRSFEPPPGPMGAVRFFRHLLDEERPDLLLTYNWGSMDAVLAARSARLNRHVHHEDGFNADEADRLHSRRNWARRVSLRSTDLVVPSENLLRIARKTWRLSRSHLIPNGIDANRFRRDAAAGAAFREAHGIPADAFVLGAVGHLRPVKNFPRLVRAAADAPFPADRPGVVCVVGEGPERGAIEAAAAAAEGKVQVVLTGHLTELAAAYSAFDAMAITSDSEQQPVSLLEAMAAEVPVVATDVGDVSQTLPPEARVFVVPLGARVEADLAGAIGRLAGAAEQRGELARVGLERVRERYSLDAMVATYGELYEGALRR